MRAAVVQAHTTAELLAQVALAAAQTAATQQQKVQLELLILVAAVAAVELIRGRAAVTAAPVLLF